VVRSGGRRRSPKDDDAELGAAVERAQAGDETAFTLVYRLVDPLLLGYVRAIVGPAEAEDVTSETWLEIARDLGRFRGDGAGFRGWAATIARHRALDHLRWQRSRPRVTLLEQDVLELPGAEDTAAQALENLSTEQAVALIATLPRTRPRPSSFASSSASTAPRPPASSASGPARSVRPRTGA
jgi:RNA polymerase sigma-70 factor (ECF subfamily)